MADEEKKVVETTNESSSSSGTTNTFAYQNPETSKYINDMYDANINAQTERLKAQEAQGISDYEQNKVDIGKKYQQQQNAQAVDYERQRRNFNQSAALNGINTGASSQAQLAQNTANQNAQAKLRASEASDIAQQNKSIADLKVQTQSAINEAVATNDYNRASALLQNYQTEYQNAVNKASTLASYGDFSGYVGIYGQDQADQMARSWALSNPKLAYSLGKITAKEYFQMTGSYPPGYKTGGSGGYRGPGIEPPPNSDVDATASDYAIAAKLAMNDGDTATAKELANKAMEKSKDKNDPSYQNGNLQLAATHAATNGQSGYLHSSNLK